MKNRKIILMYIILLVYTIANNYVIISSFAKYYNLLINPLLLLIVAMIFYVLFPKKQRKIRYKYEQIQNIIIILFIYSMIYFLSGLIFGYEYSIYGRDLSTIIQNIYSFITVIILSEYIRNKLVVNTEDNVINNVLISLFLLSMSTNFTYLVNHLYPFSTGFKYMTSNFIPDLVTTFILTYLSRTTGLKATIIYRSWLRLIPIILPILPKLPWILTSIIGIVLPMVIYFNISYLTMMYDRKNRRFSLNKNDKGTTILTIIVIMFVLFILKIFKYFPIAVLSNSMETTFSKGDAVIIEKIDKNSLGQLKVYDIIYYKKNNKLIIHRIEQIEEIDNKRVFITKGDNNPTKDPWYVYEEDIIGIMKFKIPCLGYPAVWFNEAINN